MKATDQFKSTIEAMLNKLAEADEMFAVRMQREDKNVDDCVTYILNRVQKSGCSGFADEEILNMAAHYYDEDDIDVGNPVNCRVVVNHTVELTEEEIEQAREKAKRQVVEEERQRLIESRSAKPKKKAPEKVESQGSLF